MEVKRLSQIFSIFNNNLKGPVPEEVIPILINWKVIPKEGDYMCPNGHPYKLVQNNQCTDGYIWCCWKQISRNKKKNVKCNCKVSFRKNTFFEKSQLSVCQILVFVFLWLENLPLSFIMTETEIDGKQTAVDWNSFCREVVIFGSFQTNLQIGGQDVVVEIDESKIGKRKHHRGHHVEGQWIFGGVERISGKCFMVPVENRSRETLLPLIQKYILPGSIIVSDFWKSYDTLTEFGYSHQKVNHSISFINDNGQHTNTIEGLWRHLKRSVPEYNRRTNFFNGYVQKFIFIRWCKANGKNKFIEFLKMAGKMYNPLNNKIDHANIINMARDEFDESDSET